MSKATTVHCLIRFGPSERCEEFCSTGRLYMNTLRYFKNLERRDTLRADKSEGLAASFPAKKVSVSFGASATEALPIKNLIGQVTLGDPRDIEINIFSLYALTEKTEKIIVDDRVLGFGDTSVVILDGDEFLRRALSALEQRGWSCSHDLVDYVDKDTHSGEMGPFKKYSDLEYQSEFRIAAKTCLRGPVTDLYIGNLSDITHLGKSETLRDRFRIEPK